MPVQKPSVKSLFLRPLTWVFLLAFVLRAAPNVYLEWREPGWHANTIDELEFYYDDVARSVIVGEGFVHSVNPRPGCPWGFTPGAPFHFVPPLYAWWVALVYFVFGPNILVAKILQGLMDSCVCLLLYILARRVTGDNKTALLSALLYAVYPLAIYVGQHLYYQVPLNLALIWLVLCLMAPVTWRSGIWSGLALAVSALAKPVTLPLIALLPAVRLVECVRHRIPLRVCLLWCACFTAASIAALAPWTVRNFLVFHRFVPVQHGGGNTIFNGSKEEFIDLDVVTYRKRYAQEIAAARDNYSRAALNNHLEHAKKAPLDYMRFLLKKFLFTWYNTESKTKNGLSLMIQAPYLLLAGLGLLSAPRLWLRNGNWYVPALVLYFCGVYVVFNPFVRYTLAVMPMVIVVAAVGGAWLLRRFVVYEGQGTVRE